MLLNLRNQLVESEKDIRKLLLGEAMVNPNPGRVPERNRTGGISGRLAIYPICPVGEFYGDVRGRGLHLLLGDTVPEEYGRNLFRAARYVFTAAGEFMQQV